MYAKKLLGLTLAFCMLSSFFVPAVSADVAQDDYVFEPTMSYELSVTPDERLAIHDEVDKLSGDVGDIVIGDGRYDPTTLVGGMLTGASYDSISYGSRNAVIPTEYPFPVESSERNRMEGERKTAKFNWVEQLAKDLGFDVVVHRQSDKYVYVEIGDPDAPEMIMALSHLDSPTSSVSAAQLSRWRGADGTIGDPTAYYTPYVKDGWLYGAGVQDDSGPTLATLYAAKALMEAGLPLDRRIRIVMGAYEDNNPGIPSLASTLNYMDIPYLTTTGIGFYDNWAYKYLNREETPIAAYTSDSRFPVIVGNSRASTPWLKMDLSGDVGKAFSLKSAVGGVTLREGDETLKDIVYGSAAQIASRAIITLDVSAATEAQRNAFIASVNDAATALGWLPTEEGTTPKVQITYNDEDGTLVLETNTGVAMEYPTPMYGKNGIVWAMYLISTAFDELNVNDLQLKVAADTISDLFFRNQEEGESYIGKNMGIPYDLLRNPVNGIPNLTLALMGNINNEVPLPFFYDDEAHGTVLLLPLQIRSMHVNEADFSTAMEAVVTSLTDGGFELVSGSSGNNYGRAFTYSFSNPSLYANHDNLLIPLQYASYKASMEDDPDAFTDVSGLLDISYPLGTTGGTLATNYTNKMTAFGAVIPGNERWWHSANERVKIDSIIEMTKMMADGMLEMARYSGPAGAQLMWADIDGLNADRADLDLLDVTVGTYQDASDAVDESFLERNEVLLGATKFDIEMWKQRGNSSFTEAAYQLGHEEGGVYLPLDNEDFLANTFVLPMRLEFRAERPAGVTGFQWRKILAGDYSDFAFSIVKDGEVIPLTVPEGEDASKYFSTRVSQYNPDVIYVSVNLAITDAPYDGVSTVLADSKTDLYSLNSEYLANHEDPFPERGQIEERGFFLFGDGEKNACFESPDAIFVTTEKPVIPPAGPSEPTEPAEPAEPAKPVSYVDVKDSDWFAGAVAYVTEKGLMNGVSADRFAPNEATTRGMMMTLLARMDGVDTTGGTTWYQKGLDWAVANGISDGTNPEVTVTREQMATMFYRYAKLKGYDLTATTGAKISDFADAAEVSDWAKDGVSWAVGTGVLIGANGKLMPGDNSTRAQIALVVERFCKQYKI